MPNVLVTADRFKKELLNKETLAVNDLLDTYQLLTRRLETNIQLLESEIALLHEQGVLSQYRLNRLGTLGRLLNQLDDEVTKFGGFVDTRTRLASKQAIDLAGDHSYGLVRSYFENPDLTKVLAATWDRLPTEAIQELLGFLQSDSQLSINLSSDLGNQASKLFKENLLEGIALGYNPKKINSIINRSLGSPLTWSINTIRTAQLWSYREASRANYIANSEVVSGWYWYASLDGRVCLSCVSQHGKEYPLEQPLNDHHQGRCVAIPKVLDLQKFGLPELEIQKGEDWFNTLSVSEQRERMGNSRYESFMKKEFQFSELSEPYQNDVYGEMLRVRSLKNL